MKREPSVAELERRWLEIDLRPPEEPTPEDLAAIAAAEAEDPSESITLKEYQRQHHTKRKHKK